MSFKAALSSLAILMGTAFAQQDGDSASVESRQTSLLEKLTNYEANALGFAINGTARAGFLRSTLDADDAVDETQLVEGSAYTHVNMGFSVRPSSESVARFDLRFHKDWQNAHREGNNSPITTWWSYDGMSLNNHLMFNLGHMRVSYTPLTVYQPMPDFIFEPTILAEHRNEVMADKNLDGSNNRLMQGANLEYHSNQLGFMDDLKLHGTLARIRNQSKKKSQVFFDFDDADRYFFGAAVGVDVSGITLGFNETYVFDHVRSARTVNLLTNSDTLYYERNNVMSGELGFDSKRLFPEMFHFGLNVEYALSNWSYLQDQKIVSPTRTLVVVNDTIVLPDGSSADRGYYTYKEVNKEKANLHKVAGLDNKSAMHVVAFGDGSMAGIDLGVKVNGVMTDKDFQAELAMTPASLGNVPVLNSDAEFKATTIDGLLSGLRSGSLENLYFTLYESVPFNSSNMLVKSKMTRESEYYRLYNNFKYAQYYRNGYNNVLLRRSELLQTSLALNPATDIAMPFGYATPNRKGGGIDLTGKWNDAVAVRVLGDFYSADELDATDSLDFITGTKYIKAGGGVNVDFARLLAMGKEWGIQLGGSYETTKETDGFERTSSRMMAGLDVTWDRVSLLTGFQMLDLEFGKPYLAVLEGTSEMLALGGIRYKIAAGAYATVEYGYMTNSIDYLDANTGKSATMDMSKNIIMADVTVKF